MTNKVEWVLGQHAVKAVLSISPERAVALYVAANSHNIAQQNIIEQATKLGLPFHTVDKRILSQRCDSTQHQGIALEARPKHYGSDQELDALVRKLLEHGNPLLLILDQVQDPHNFGACLRTADAAGVDAVIVAKDNACPVSPVVQKVASGAVETMPVYRVTNLARAMDSMKKLGVWMVGTSDAAPCSLYQQELDGAIGLVMGAEGRGLRNLTQKKCDSLVSLPMAGSVVSSLNVSVATGICLYEIVRQRSLAKR